MRGSDLEILGLKTCKFRISGIGNSFFEFGDVGIYLNSGPLD